MRHIENPARARGRAQRRFASTMTGLALMSGALLAACGGSGGTYGSANGPTGGASSSSTNGTVKTSQNAGIGTILTDSAGKTLYAAEQEADGKIACTDACTAFWLPLTTSSRTVSSSTDLPGELGTVKRPDSGKLQVTYDGMPLYTFKLDDEPGDTKGNDLTDVFKGKTYAWHAMTTKPTTEGSSTPSSNDTGGGYKY